jgi:hypothetical protein
MLRRAGTLGLLSLLLSSGSLLADVVWKAADEGSRTPVITEIVVMTRERLLSRSVRRQSSTGNSGFPSR